MSKTLVICGNGPSAGLMWWSFTTPLMAVSSGYNEAGYIDHFVSMDRPVNFPRWVTDSDRFDKHLPRGMYQDLWAPLPRVRFWDYTHEKDEPDFLDPDYPCVCGPQPRNHSLLFGVQVAHKLGFRRLIFIGVDFTEPGLYPINDVMKQWYWKIRDLGLEWENASPMSLMQEWMPDCTGDEAKAFNYYEYAQEATP